MSVSDTFETNMQSEGNGCADFESRKNHEPKAVGEILPDTSFFAEVEDCEETTVAAAAEPGNVASKEGCVRKNLAYGFGLVVFPVFEISTAVFLRLHICFKIIAHAQYTTVP